MIGIIDPEQLQQVSCTASIRIRFGSGDCGLLKHVFLGILSRSFDSLPILVFHSDSLALRFRFDLIRFAFVYEQKAQIKSRPIPMSYSGYLVDGGQS